MAGQCIYNRPLRQIASVAESIKSHYLIDQSQMHTTKNLEALPCPINLYRSVKCGSDILQN